MPGTNAGFVHLSCLVEYAEKKNTAWIEVGSRDIKEFRKPWAVCPNCHQHYQNAMSVDVANEFVSFVQKEHPNNKQKQVEALELKLSSLCKSLKPFQVDEAREVATRLLILIGQMKVETLMLPTRYMQAEAFTYYNLGMIAHNVKKEESYQEALAHFNKCLELSTAINFIELIAIAKYIISLARSRLEREESKQNEEEQVKICQDLYVMRVTRHGEEHAGAIKSGMMLAVAFWNANRRIEAKRLLTGLVAVSERVNGPQNGTTKRAKSLLQEVNAHQAD